jgi:two-component system sensor histidine kinase DegS
VINALPELAAELERDRSTIERELSEIELLMRQAASEAERHESRRVQAEERVTALETDHAGDPAALSEARTQLLSQTRRQTMMQSQVEVLEGKQRALRRFHARIEQIVPVLNDSAAAGIGGIGPGTAAAAQGARDVMAAQDEMRREIARQMHDGPAQSIANIALQAQVVQRLFDRDPRQADHELGQLVAMVQNALEQTKDFIFDVRPMVLDDLGLVPTLRRAAAERGRRTGQPVVFESVGADSRMPTEMESGLFRLIDDAVQALIEAQPAEVIVRLDWMESAVSATIRGRPRNSPGAQSEKAQRAVADARRDKVIPAALASMIHEQETSDSRGIPAPAWDEIRDRAAQLGIDATLSDDGWQLDARVGFRR